MSTKDENAGHTPTPWKVGSPPPLWKRTNDVGIHGDIHDYVDEDCDGETRTCVTTVAVAIGTEADRSAAEANARHIVHCVNTHAALREACEAAEKVLANALGPWASIPLTATSDPAHRALMLLRAALREPPCKE